MIRVFRTICLSTALMFLLVAAASGQAVNATLLGTVTDATEAVVAGAKVVVTEMNTGVSRATQTNDNGNYSFPNLPPGVYSVSVEMAGFRKETRQGVTAAVNSAARADMRLQPGSVSESIEVKEEAATLKTDRSDTGRTMNTKVVADIVLGANRNYQSLLDLVPGTTEGFVQFSLFRNASSTLQTQVNGQANASNSYLIEGVDNTNNSRNNQMVVPPAEAIDTVEISTSNHDVELGNSGGAVTNVMLKSGTNAYHGGVYHFLRNTALDARAFFDPIRGHEAFNYVGGNLGGPIKKNKLFFFGDFLRVMDHEARPSLATIPSMAYRAGDLSAASATIYDPLTGNADGSGRAPFSGKQIPANRFDAVSTRLMALLPAPNLPFNQSAPSNNYYGDPAFRKTINQFDVKVDYYLGSADRLSVRLSRARPQVYQAPLFGDVGGGPAQGGFEGTGDTRIYNGNINYSKGFSPTLISEFRLGVGYSNNEALPSGFGRNDATDIGIPGANIDPFSSGMVGININNFSGPLLGYSPSIPWMKADTNVGLTNSWTKTKGNHTIKFGGEVRRLRSVNLQLQTYSPRGAYSFGPNPTSTTGQSSGIGNSFASFLLDVPNSAGRDLSTYTPSLRASQFFLHGGDQWQVSRRLTANLGLRWEFHQPATAPYPGGFSNYDYTNDRLLLAGKGDIPLNLGQKAQYRNFGPRAGIAYRLSPGTVIRTGFGISHVTPLAGGGWQMWNYPVRAVISYLAPNSNPYLPVELPDGRKATFQVGFPAPAPIPLPADGIIKNPGLTTGFTVYSTDLKIQSVQAWNFAIQQALPFQFSLDVAYVGNHGVDIYSSVELNPGLVLGAGDRGKPLFPRVAGTGLQYQGFSSSYNSLQVKLDRRFQKRLGVTTSFTYGKAMGYPSFDDGGLLFYINPRRNWARTNFDRTFNYVQSFIYQMPFGKNNPWLKSGPANLILGGWQASGILSLRSGTPMTFSANGAGLNAPSNSQTPNLIAPIKVLHGINVGNPWFDTSSFAQPVGAVFGNLGRNVLDGPAMGRLDLSLFKTMRFRERYGLEVRAESYNLTNTPAFANPSTSLTSATFGMVTGTIGSGAGVSSAGGGRWLRLGAKFTF